MKDVVSELRLTVGVDGLNEGAAAFARRLRQHRDAILTALSTFEMPKPFGPGAVRILSPDELSQAILRIKARSRGMIK